MTDRTTKVTLIAQAAGFVSGMDQAANATRRTTAETQKLAQSQASVRQASREVGIALLAVGAIAAAGVAVAVAKFAEFDQAMSNVNAVTQETAENMSLLRAAALDAGGRTVFTATQAANAIEELGKAGLSTADILEGGLEGALSLAASGQLDVARAAEITATTLKQYGLAGTEAAHVSDVLSAGAGKALGSVEDLANGLKFVGPIAASMGVSLEETTGALSMFADQGLIGEQAGTSLRGVLSSLTSPSSMAAKEIDRLGISLYDTGGNFLGLENVAGQLSNAYSDLDDRQTDMSLGMIFGNQQITAARVLFESGGDALHKYTEQVNDSGYASRVAADRMDNLKGDVEKLGGAFDNVLIKSGSAANDTLRDLTQAVTFLVDGIGDLPEPALGAGLAIGVAVAAIALAGGAALIAVPKIAEFKLALNTLNVSGKAAAVGIGAASAALSGAIFVLGLIVSRQAEAKASSDAFADSLDQTTGALTKYSRQLVAKRLQEQGVFDAAEKVGLSQREVTDAVIEGGVALDAVTKKINDYANAHGGWGTAEQVAAQNLRDTRTEIDDGTKSWDNIKKAGDGAADTTDDNTSALRELQGASSAARDDIDKLADMIRGFGDATLSSRDAQRQFQAAVDDAAESLKENGKTLDIGTDAGRRNEAALDGIAKSAKEAAAAIFEQTGSQEDASTALQVGRDELLKMLAQFDITGQAADDYADRLGLIPANVGTVVDLNTSPADKALQDFFNRWNGKTVNLRATTSGQLGSGILGRAEGGILPGAPSRSDNMLIAAASGEFLTNSVATAKNRSALEYINSGGVIRGYANGGEIGRQYAPAPVYAPPAAQYMQAGRGDIHVDLNLREVTDTQAVAEVVMQGLRARLVGV